MREADCQTDIGREGTRKSTDKGGWKEFGTREAQSSGSKEASSFKSSLGQGCQQ